MASPSGHYRPGLNGGSIKIKIGLNISDLIELQRTEKDRIKLYNEMMNKQPELGLKPLKFGLRGGSSDNTTDDSDTSDDNEENDDSLREDDVQEEDNAVGGEVNSETTSAEEQIEEEEEDDGIITEESTAYDILAIIASGDDITQNTNVQDNNGLVYAVDSFGKLLDDELALQIQTCEVMTNQINETKASTTDISQLNTLNAMALDYQQMQFDAVGKKQAISQIKDTINDIVKLDVDKAAKHFEASTKKLEEIKDKIDDYRLKIKNAELKDIQEIVSKTLATSRFGEELEKNVNVLHLNADNFYKYVVANPKETEFYQILSRCRASDVKEIIKSDIRFYGLEVNVDSKGEIVFKPVPDVQLKTQAKMMNDLNIKKILDKSIQPTVVTHEVNKVFENVKNKAPPNLFKKPPKEKEASTAIDKSKGAIPKNTQISVKNKEPQTDAEKKAAEINRLIEMQCKQILQKAMAQVSGLRNKKDSSKDPNTIKLKKSAEAEKLSNELQAKIANTSKSNSLSEAFKTIKSVTKPDTINENSEKAKTLALIASMNQSLKDPSKTNKTDVVSTSKGEVKSKIDKTIDAKAQIKQLTSMVSQLKFDKKVSDTANKKLDVDPALASAIKAVKSKQLEKDSSGKQTSGSIKSKSTHQPSKVPINTTFRVSPIDHPKKVGEHSVKVNGVVTLSHSLQAPHITQNAFQWALPKCYDNVERIGWNADSNMYYFSTETSTPTNSTHMQTYDYVDGWHSFFLARTPPNETKIVYTQAQTRQRLDKTKLVDFKTGDLLKSKTVSDVLISALQIDKELAEKLSSEVDWNTNKCDNSGLFLLGCLIVKMINDYEHVGVGCTVAVPAQNSIRSINIKRNRDQTEIMIEEINEAITSGSFILDRRYWSDKDLQCAMALTTGMQGVIPAAELEINHVLQRYRMEGIRFVIIQRNNNQLPQPGIITASEMWSFLIKLSGMRNMKKCFVKGCTLAARVFNGKFYVENRSKNVIWLTCTMEYKRIDIPQPRDCNFLWGVLQLEGVEPDKEMIMMEWNELSSLGVDAFIRCTVLLSAMLSSSISTIFDRYSLTGREIGSPRYPDNWPRLAVPIIKSLVLMPEEGTICAMFPRAAQLIAEMSGCIFSAELFKFSEWSAGYKGIQENLDHNEIWSAVWQTYIPYMFDPICIASFLNAMPDQWGISQPVMGMDLTKESIVTGYDEVMGWYANKGCKEYEANLAARRGYLPVTYGRFCLNFMLQHHPLNIERIRIHWLQMANTASGSEVVNLGLVNCTNQPILGQGIPHIRPGTLINFDWDTGKLYIPVILKRSLNNMSWLMLSSADFKESITAGICTYKITEHNPAVGFTTMEEMHPGMGSWNAPTAGTAVNKKKFDKEN